MEKEITFIYPYYDNPNMLTLHQDIWEKYPKRVLNRTSFIIVDDCSPRYPAVDYIKSNGLDISLFRLQEDLKWNWEGARNIGAYEAQTDWLLMTDIDHVVPEDTILWILNRLSRFSKKIYCTFSRVDAPDMIPYKQHPNSYLLSKELYWEAGGYDEEPNILTGGIYGNDGPFRRWLDRFSTGCVPLYNCDLIRYTSDIVKDAACDFLSRKEGRDDKLWRKMITLSKKKFQKNIMATTMSFPYEEIKLNVDK